MVEFNNVKKLCSFYVSNMHLATMILPYTNKKLNQKTKFITFLENDLETNINMVLSRLILNDEAKEKISKVNWNSSNICKFSNTEKKLKHVFIQNEEVTILISGSEKYIKLANDNIYRFLEKNKNKMDKCKINIIDCFEVGEFNENVKMILDTHDLILNTSGEHEIKDVFEGYEKQIAY